MDFHEIAFVVAVYVLAGAIKGIVGIGLPIVSISLLSQILDPRLAISLTLVPLITTNVWQCIRVGGILPTVRQLMPYALALMFFIYVSAQFAHGVSASAILLIMGVSVVLFTLVNLFVVPPPLPPAWDRPVQVIAGAASGIMGGITSIWGPPIIVYLLARRTMKDAFLRATGVLLTVGCIPMIISYWRAGHFDGEVAAASTLMVLPAVAGFQLGERLRDRLDAGTFRRIVLLLFLIVGMNLVRRGLTI